MEKWVVILAGDAPDVQSRRTPFSVRWKPGPAGFQNSVSGSYHTFSQGIENSFYPESFWETKNQMWGFDRNGATNIFRSRNTYTGGNSFSKVVSDSNHNHKKDLRQLVMILWTRLSETSEQEDKLNLSCRIKPPFFNFSQRKANKADLPPTQIKISLNDCWSLTGSPV